MTASDKLAHELLETIERLRATMQGASDAEIHEVIISAGLQALRPVVEMIEWRKPDDAVPRVEEVVLIVRRVVLRSFPPAREGVEVCFGFVDARGVWRRDSIGAAIDPPKWWAPMLEGPR